MDSQNKVVADYYDQTLRFYDRFWHKDSYGVHYGFWDKSTKTLQDALLNQNKFMAETLKISTGAKILDAGCGIGGSSIWLAKNYDVTVEGITLSAMQLERANTLSNEHNLSKRINFSLQDYLKTSFKKNYFDVVWGEESVCYAKNKEDFLVEAYRVLKPGGKLVVADGVRRRNIRESEKKQYKDFLDGLVLPNISDIREFEAQMVKTGFKNVKVWDKTQAVRRSSKIMYRKVLLLYPLAKLLFKLGLISPTLFNNSRAGLAQYKLVKSGAAGYAVFYGEK